MRTLLFVQVGDARPVRIATLTASRAYFKRDTGRDPEPATMLMWLTDLQEASRHAADRWWIVECENAEQGRRAIYAIGNVHPSGARLAGRILATGPQR